MVGLNYFLKSVADGGVSFPTCVHHQTLEPPTAYEAVTSQLQAQTSHTEGQRAYNLLRITPNLASYSKYNSPPGLPKLKNHRLEISSGAWGATTASLEQAKNLDEREVDEKNDLACW